MPDIVVYPLGRPHADQEAGAGRIGYCLAGGSPKTAKGKGSVRFSDMAPR